MTFLPFQFRPEGNYIELVGIADLHIGAKTFNEKRALRHRDYILDHPDRKVVDLGDHTENALRDSPGNALYEQKLSPSEQRAAAKEYYSPLRDRVLCVCESNHSGRSTRLADIGPDDMLCAFLGAPLVVEGMLSVTVGDGRYGQSYNILVRHSVGNCCTPASIIAALQRKSMRVQGLDAICVGHSHQYVYYPQVAEIPDPRHKKVRVVTQHLCCSDSFMDFDDSYAQSGNYARPVPGQIALRLYKDRHEIEVVRLLP